MQEHKTAPAFKHLAGSRQPKMLLIGEAFGKDEESLGLPFVGESGKELFRMLGEAMPSVKRMGFISHSIPLDFLRNFRNLRSLAMDQRSQSTPSQTLDILRSLRHLKELEFPLWLGTNRKNTRAPYPLELNSIPIEYSNEFRQYVSIIQVLGLKLTPQPPFGMALLAHPG